MSIGEAMVPMSPAGPGTYAQSFAGDTFNSAWHLAQLLDGSAGARAIVVKNGDAPVSFTSDATTGVVETPAVVQVVDTTGAGDAFNAGDLAGRLLEDPAGRSSG